MNIEPTDIRVRYETVPFTRMDRFKVWFWRVWFAVTGELPHSYVKTIEVRPGEEGYDDAPMHMGLIMMKDCFKNQTGE